MSSAGTALDALLPVDAAVIGTIAIANGAAGKATANVFTAAQTVNLNAASPPAGIALSTFHSVTNDGAANIHLADTFSAAGAFVGRRAQGTGAAPSAVQSGNIISEIAGRGYGATAYGRTTAAVKMAAQENWTDAAQGTQLQFTTTPVGSVTESIRWVMAANGDFLPNVNASYSVGNASNRVLYGYFLVLSTSATTVAGLAGVASPSAGMRWFVTDANATKATGDGNVVVGGGSNGVPVYYDGTNWRIG